MKTKTKTIKIVLFILNFMAVWAGLMLIVPFFVIVETMPLTYGNVAIGIGAMIIGVGLASITLAGITDKSRQINLPVKQYDDKWLEEHLDECPECGDG